jgi:hypothetical protein
VEGGPETASRFLESKLVDRCVLIKAPVTFTDPVPSKIDPKVLCVLLSSNSERQMLLYQAKSRPRSGRPTKLGRGRRRDVARMIPINAPCIYYKRCRPPTIECWAKLEGSTTSKKLGAGPALDW